MPTSDMGRVARNAFPVIDFKAMMTSTIIMEPVTLIKAMPRIGED
jgi:hypothetical protein